MHILAGIIFIIIGGVIALIHFTLIAALALALGWIALAFIAFSHSLEAGLGLVCGTILILAIIREMFKKRGGVKAMGRF